MHRLKQLKESKPISVATNISVLGFLRENNKSENKRKSIRISDNYDIKEIIENGKTYYIPGNK